MKIAHAADLHIGAELPGQPNAIPKAVDAFVDDAIEKYVDAAVWSGDTFHSRRPTPMQLRTAVRAAKRLNDAGIPLIIGTGNHDGYASVGDPDSHVLGWWHDLDLDGVTVLIDRGVHGVLVKHQYLRVAHLPYPHKRLEPGQTVADRVRLGGERAAEHLVELAGESPDLLVAHVSVSGAMLGPEQAMRMGWDTMVSEDLMAAFPYVALGHIHRQQPVAPNAWYPGTPLVTGWGDPAAGWLIVDLPKEGEGIGVFARAAQGPPWLTIDVWEREDWQVLPFPPGAILKVILHPEQRLTNAAQRKVVDALNEGGAGYVRLEVAAPPSARAGGQAPPPESFDVVTLMTQWLQARGIEADAPMALGREIVEAVHSARNSEGS